MLGQKYHQFFCVLVFCFYCHFRMWYEKRVSSLNAGGKALKSPVSCAGGISLDCLLNIFSTSVMEILFPLILL
jgi:hypothetical protein